MKFKGTIIITDPCYVIKECTEENPYPFPYTAEYINSPNRAELIKQYNKWRDSHDDWGKCKWGQNMEALGIKHYITESTIYGDWGCSTYQIQENPKEIVDKLATACKASKDEYVGVGVKVIKELGNFCADAGLVSVFYLDEILKYNPDFNKLAEEHPWGVTTIPDFDGEVEYYIDANNEAHIIGTGNINFFTTQTSL